MSLFENNLSKAAISTCLVLSLSACIPKPETDLSKEDRQDDPKETDASDKRLSLPQTPYDYVAYADSNLPDHFTSGTDNPLSHDNTENSNVISNAGATLGRVLFYDNALSANDAVSCASCHSQKTGFSDNAQFSEGFQEGLTARHSMSLSNNRFYNRGHYFWDERANTLEDQVLMPIQDDVEMGMTLDALVVKLAELEYYPELFNAAFGSDEITSQRIALALAQFTRAMVSYQSPYDRAIETASDVNDLSHALSSNEEAGRKLFELPPPQGGFGCGGCHAGVAQITDEPHNIGLDLNTPDEGVGDGKFKVPSLRNIELSAPYMHDGRFSTLAQVIEHYNSGVQNHPDLAQVLKHPVSGQPVNLNMTSLEKQQLEAFLHTLTDDAFIQSDLFSDPFSHNH